MPNIKMKIWLPIAVEKSSERKNYNKALKQIFKTILVYSMYCKNSLILIYIIGEDGYFIKLDIIQTEKKQVFQN